MMRTSLYLPPALHEHLRIVSRQRKLPLSNVVRELLGQALAIEKNTRLDQMYKELAKLEGACKEKVTDASTTIDEVLYGEKGAWRGNE